MRMKEISYGMSRTINLGNYESTKIEITAVGMVDEDENPTSVYERLRDTVKDRILEEARDAVDNDFRKKMREEL